VVGHHADEEHDGSAQAAEQYRGRGPVFGREAQRGCRSEKAPDEHRGAGTDPKQEPLLSPLTGLGWVTRGKAGEEEAIMRR
jgi:hypothetical protein